MTAYETQETIWFNQTDNDVTIDIYVEPTRIAWARQIEKAKERGDDALRELRTGMRRYVVKAGEQRALDKLYDWCIQTMKCLEPTCVTAPLDCTDDGHKKLIIGGLAPQLVKLGLQQPTKRPSMQAAVNDAVCQTCGNTKVSKAEKVCWKCGAKLT